MNTDLGTVEGSQQTINAMENTAIAASEAAKDGSTLPAEDSAGKESGMFADEGVLTEDMLRGEAAKEEPPKDDKPNEATTGDDTATPGPQDAKKEESESGKDAKPPEGFIPISEVQKERGKRQELSRRVAELEAENVSLKTASETHIPLDPEMPEDLREFKVLNETEFKELSEADPIASSQYLFNLRRFETAKTAIEGNREGAKAVISQGMSKLTAVMPDFYEEGSVSNKELSDFAKEIGFANPALFSLTDPATRVILPGQKKAVLLGEAAADLVLMLKNARERIAAGGASEAELREKITKEVTETLVAKVKAGESLFPPSIGDAPSGGSEAPGKSAVVEGEDGYRLMPAEDKRNWLGG